MPPSPRRFALDYDGTIADTNALKARWVRERLGLKVAAACCDRTSLVPVIGERAYRRLAEAVYEAELSAVAEPLAGAEQGLRRLAAAGEVYVVSARLPHRLAYARAWLAARGLAGCVREVLTSHGGTKAALCARLGAQCLIDDDPRHLRALAGTGCAGLLLKDAPPPPLPAGVQACRSWAECLAALGVARERGAAESGPGA